MPYCGSLLMGPESKFRAVRTAGSAPPQALGALQRQWLPFAPPATARRSDLLPATPRKQGLLDNCNTTGGTFRDDCFSILQGQRAVPHGPATADGRQSDQKRRCATALS